MKNFILIILLGAIFGLVVFASRSDAQEFSLPAEEVASSTPAQLLFAYKTTDEVVVDQQETIKLLEQRIAVLEKIIFHK